LIPDLMMRRCRFTLPTPRLSYQEYRHLGDPKNLSDFFD
jgi:hypothetical protein